jgi:cytosine/adenosine deaminase-related metal-dependent hydrolase
VTQVFSAGYVIPIDGPPIEDGAVAIDEGAIVAVGSRDELGEGERFPEAAILPGLVNAHSHLEYAVYAGFGDGLPFGPWLALHIERKGRLGWEEFCAIAKLGAAECLRSGITTIADASFSGAAAEAALELGLRGLVCKELFGTDTTQLDEEAGWRSEFEARAGKDRVRVGLSPHAPYSASADLYRGAFRAADVPTITHVAESDDELEYLRSGRGPIAQVGAIQPPGTTPVRYLASEGLLRAQMIAAHCVKVDAEEIDLLAAHDVGVAHCPRSNALLGCGIAPLASLRSAGIRVGLGTDSPASTPSFDFFEEMRAAISVARARAERPDALSADDALELATLGAASALGLHGEIGSLAPGKRADLTVVSLSGSPYLPWENPAAAVVYGGSPERVLLTLVDGEERYRKGGMAWHELRRAAAEARSRLLGAPPVAQKT